MRPLLALAFAVCSALFAPAAMAQSGTEMLLAPWDDDQQFALEARAGVVHTHVDAPGGANVTVWSAMEEGRVHTPGMPLMVGWKTNFVGFDAPSSAGLTGSLHDTAVSLATSLTPGDRTVGAFGERWDLGIELGAGQASNTFSDGDGWYFSSALLAVSDLSPTETLKVAIAYDGNRSFMPDVPLPGFEYRNSARREFVWFVGVPRTGFIWKPTNRWAIDAQWNLFTPGPLTVDYDIGGGWHFFGFYGTRRLIAHLDGDEDNKRLIWSSTSAEAGLRWYPRRGVELSFSAGWAFGMDLDRGFDTRNSDTLVSFDDAVVAHVQLKIKL